MQSFKFRMARLLAIPLVSVAASAQAQWREPAGSSVPRAVTRTHDTPRPASYSTPLPKELAVKKELTVKKASLQEDDGVTPDAGKSPAGGPAEPGKVGLKPHGDGHLAACDCGTPCQDACNGCDSCGSSCSACDYGIQTCRECAGWSAGIEAVFVKPHFENSVGIPAGRAPIGGLAELIGNSVQFDYEASPRVWLGYQDACGLGGRLTYFNFDSQSDEIVAINFPAQGLDSFFNSDISIQVSDLELTHKACFCSWNFTFSGGLRYVEYEMESSLFFATAPVGTGIIVEFARNRHEFHGWGPTIGLEAVRPIDCTNFSIFANGRFSLVFGEATGEVNFLDVQGVPNTFAATRDDLLSMVDLQLGVEWKKCLDGGANLFIRTAVEGQLYAGAGDVANENGDFGLFGGNLQFGIKR